MRIQVEILDNKIVCSDGEKTILTIVEDIVEEKATLTLCGELVSAVANEFRTEILAFIVGGCDVILDLKETTYISNVCQDVLIEMQQRVESQNRGSLRLCNLSSEMNQALEKTGLKECLNFMSVG